MVSVLTSSAVDRGFKSQSGQTKHYKIDMSVVDSGFDPQSGQAKNYKIGICRFSTKHAAFRS
jgi:hypothetical protein